VGLVGKQSIVVVIGFVLVEVKAVSAVIVIEVVVVV
jgi:hypothetical protein